MKLINSKKLLNMLLLLVICAACVEGDDFNTPTLVIESPTFPENNTFVQIHGILGNLAQVQNTDGEDATVTFDVVNQYLEGYVVSSDRSGNFFEELIIQDAAVAPNAGVRILIDVNPLFITYEFGRKVFINLEGLSIGIVNGVPTIGVLSENMVGQIPSFFVEDIIIRSDEVATITPLEITIEDFSNDLMNLYIRINNVQFRKENFLGDIPLTFAGEASDEFNGERNLENCNSGANAILSTSTFADFKSLTIPAQQGSFEGLLTRNFFGDTFNLVLNDPFGLVFDTEERCDPLEVGCGIANTVGTTTIFSDDFETQSNNSPISGNGWTNFIEIGTESWEAFSSTSTNVSLGKSARAGSRNSGDDLSIIWLITPEINLDAQEGETLRFQTSNSFADGSELDVLISSDWNGDLTTITTATWGILTDAFVVQDSNFFGDWFESGNVDLSCETGMVYIAFRYTGRDNDDFDGTYELDEIRIDAN